VPWPALPCLLPCLVCQPTFLSLDSLARPCRKWHTGSRSQYSPVLLLLVGHYTENPQLHLRPFLSSLGAVTCPTWVAPCELLGRGGQLGRGAARPRGISNHLTTPHGLPIQAILHGSVFTNHVRYYVRVRYVTRKVWVGNKHTTALPIVLAGPLSRPA
jgi:hypothetical protein